MHKKVITTLLLTFALNVLFAQSTSLQKWLQNEGVGLTLQINQFDYDRYNKLINTKEIDLNSLDKIEFQGSQWSCEIKSSEVYGKSNAIDVEVVFSCDKGTLNEASVSAALNFSNWSKQNYVLMPGAVYNGNRYPSRRIKYSPKLLDPRDIGPNKGIILSDIPKLNEANGPSFIQQRSGDMTTPSIGFYSPAQQKNIFLLTEQKNNWGDYGIGISENRSRSNAEITLSSPLVRELYKYRIADSRFPSDDVPANFKANDEVVLKFRLYSQKANKTQDLFEMFSHLRKDIEVDRQPANVLPYSDAFRVQEDKFNTLNFVPEWGYYSVGMRENLFQDWQIGWTGGMISTYPLLMEGSDATRNNVIQNFDWLFPNGISPSGFFWCSGEKGNIWHGGDPRKPHTKNWHLIRKSADGLYYILIQFMLMEKLGIEVKDEWHKGAQTVANAFVSLWKENQQIGQFVDNVTGEIQVGGSTSAGILPGTLALAAEYFNNDDYLKIAKEIANYYHTNFVQKGLSYGGPGDAMQNFDSESCYALLEAYTVLFEVSGDNAFLKMAEDVAKQFSTWVISYNYEFPTHSLYAKKGIRSVGAVNANTQNKHGSPGICTYSGSALLKLFRTTNNPFYINLLHDIAHNIPQYLVHPLRPIEGVPNGYMTERVNTTDWLEGIGEIFYGSTWAETALMLTYAEVPGLYVQPYNSYFVAFDNVVLKKVKESKSKLVLQVTNPTESPAKVKILVDNSNDLETPLGHNYLLNVQELELEPGEEKNVTFKKQ